MKFLVLGGDQDGMRIEIEPHLNCMKAIERDEQRGYRERVYEKRRFVIGESAFFIFVPQDTSVEDANRMVAKHVRKILGQ